MERHFERELNELTANLIAMGGLVDEQIQSAFQALFSGDRELAANVITRDRDVDAFDTQIDEQCLRIFALTQPVAIDLRLLMSALKMNNQLERIGDIAVNVAQRVEALVDYQELVGRTRLSEMAQIARIMVRDSLDSFIQHDASIASRVLDSDDVVDDLNREIFHVLVKEMQDYHELISPAAHLLILSRHIERLADHATNIAEDVIFLVDARLVKHNAANEPHP